MTDIERTSLITKKERQIKWYTNFKNNKGRTSLIFVLNFVASIGLIVAGSLLIYELPIGAPLLLWFGIMDFIYSIVMTIIFFARGSNADFKIAKLTEEIEQLKGELEASEQPSQKEPQSKSDNIDLLIKFKQLLDDGVITQEEFDKKKKELL